MARPPRRGSRWALACSAAASLLLAAAPPVAVAMSAPPSSPGAAPAAPGGGGGGFAEVRRHDSRFFLRGADGGAGTGGGGGPPASVTSALIVLNMPVPRPPSRVFRHLWDLADLRICADGGANRLHDATAAAGGEGGDGNADGDGNGDVDGDVDGGSLYVPDLIKGDLDSLRPDVRARYEALGVRVVLDPDQETNDLDKALRSVISERERLLLDRSWGGEDDGDREGGRGSPPAAPASLEVSIYGAFGGRFDQEMASMQALYRWGDALSHRIVLYSEDTCAFLLPAGVTNEVRLPALGREGGAGGARTSSSRGDGGDGPWPMGEGATCGLIPLGGRCDYVRTTGLRWNLDGTAPTEFGGLVSTSNRIVEDVVTVQCSHPLVFTAEMVS